MNELHLERSDDGTWRLVSSTGACVGEAICIGAHQWLWIIGRHAGPAKSLDDANAQMTEYVDQLLWMVMPQSVRA